MDRRTLVADAALDVVAAHGMKGLTHRAVDAASGSPAGTTSNYFRTRAALVAAAVDRLEQRDLELWSAGADAPHDPEVLYRIGHPSEFQFLTWPQQHLWSYRYVSPFCVWFQVSLDTQDQVVALGNNNDPICTVKF